MLDPGPTATQANLAYCTKLIHEECAQPETLQKDVALSYAMALRSEAAGEDKLDWAVINRAIMDRWGKPGLKRVKDRAWKMVEGKVQP